ncbi:MAG: hypothetical protein OXU66_10880 [Gammaproteobacteria bacterium]|nr:hypothetical protein [Gammaproteobacteria bacterium]MDD9897321.1 hypothetical protein [Gammaproteobacteria bacterium]MDD9959433.1 hypothetical protein [Gammaproteobacteria bacterium]
MDIKYLQLVVGALAIEIISVLVLIIMVAIVGPSDPEQAQVFAAELGYWVGPIAGFLFCFLGAYILTRNLDRSRIPNGILLGLLVAILDVSILLSSSAAFEIIFLVSNTGRIVAGTLGAYVAERQAQGNAQDV